MKNDIIPVYKPNIKSGNEFKYVNQCLEENWISSKGRFIKSFEDKFSNFLNIKYSSTVSNGTVALHLCLTALGISQNDEVIVPTFTYIASVNSIRFVGAKPVFVDSDKNSWNINADLIEKKINKKTKAIMAVHLYGAACEMDKIIALCKKYKLYLIEDVAEGFGSKFKGKYLGSFGDVSSFSFFGNKTITTGEGGMVCSNNIKVIEKVNLLKSQYVSKTKEYWHEKLGYNYRMTNICAAIGLAQLERANEIISKKIKISKIYKRELNNTNLIFQKEPLDSINSFWMVSVLFENKLQKEFIRNKLTENNIESRPFFYPAHIMPEFKSDEKFNIAENIYERGINLPSYPDIQEDTIKKICKIINQNI